MKIDSINQHCNVIISKIPTRTKVFNSFSHPCPVIDDALSDAWDRVFINMLFDEVTIGVRADVEVIVLPDAVTDLEFAVSVLYGVDMMTNVWSGSVIKVGLSNALTTVMTVLEFIMSTSLEESLIFD